MAGRYKLGPQGAYFDASDSGPDQASPGQIAALQGQASAAQPSSTVDSQAADVMKKVPGGGITGGMDKSGGVMPAEGNQFNPYGPGGSSDNRTGPPGYYPVDGVVSGGPFANGRFSPSGSSTLTPNASGNWDINHDYGSLQPPTTGTNMTLADILANFRNRYGGSGGKIDYPPLKDANGLFPSVGSLIGKEIQSPKQSMQDDVTFDPAKRTPNSGFAGGINLGQFGS